MCVADYVAARCWSEGVQVREKRGNKGKCVCLRDLSISAVFLIQAALSGGLLLAEMTTGSISPCRRHENWALSPLFLSFLLHTFLSFLCLSLLRTISDSSLLNSLTFSFLPFLSLSLTVLFSSWSLLFPLLPHLIFSLIIVSWWLNFDFSLMFVVLDFKEFC